MVALSSAAPSLDIWTGGALRPSTVPVVDRGPVPMPSVDLQALAPLAAWMRATQGDDAFRAVCDAADIAPDAFAHGGGGLAAAQVDGFLTALRDHLGGDGALLAAGTASESRAAPPRWLKWAVTPAVLYRGHAGRACVTAGVGRSAVRGRGLGAAAIRYQSTEACGRLACLWRQARLARRTAVWGLPPAVVHETRCLARSDAACEYVVYWQASPRWTPALGATAVTIAGLLWRSASPGLAWSLPVIAALLAHAIEIERVRRANQETAGAFGAAFRRATALMPPRQAELDVAVPVASAGDEGASLRREGDFWRITFASKTVLVRHSRGLSLLVHLLRNPNQDIHVSALDAFSPSEGAAVAAPASSVALGEPVGDLGDAGEVLDAQAKATYRRHLIELREELAEAETCNDIGRAESLRAEIEALVDQLREATGLGGRSRRAASNVNRVRVAVTRRVRAAIAQIEKHHPPLGAHLSATIHTGYFCSYGPGGVPWRE